MITKEISHLTMETWSDDQIRENPQNASQSQSWCTDPVIKARTAVHVSVTGIIITGGETPHLAT